MTAGFVCFDLSQVFNLYSICKDTKNGILLLIKGSDINFEKIFNSDFFVDICVPYALIDSNDLLNLEDDIDVLIFSNPFPWIYKIRKTKTVWVQIDFNNENYDIQKSSYIFDLIIAYDNFDKNISNYKNIFFVRSSNKKASKLIEQLIYKPVINGTSLYIRNFLFSSEEQINFIRKKNKIFLLRKFLLNKINFLKKILINKLIIGLKKII